MSTSMRTTLQTVPESLPADHVSNSSSTKQWWTPLERSNERVAPSSPRPTGRPNERVGASLVSRSPTLLASRERASGGVCVVCCVCVLAVPAEEESHRLAKVASSTASGHATPMLLPKEEPAAAEASGSGGAKRRHSSIVPLASSVKGQVLRLLQRTKSTRRTASPSTNSLRADKPAMLTTPAAAQDQQVEPPHRRRAATVSDSGGSARYLSSERRRARTKQQVSSRAGGVYL
ncbi:Hypothetical predicted protein [Cloeon dipterum]|uniref:Uncharacterized protein n=1 Tax=Cloeon dipterum TaxID=197152 RepID=A0A8S1CI17_9INSE|nr:Hypothetical predicted protein [Cloeon dipterum]